MVKKQSDIIERLLSEVELAIDPFKRHSDGALIFPMVRLQLCEWRELIKEFEGE